MRLLTRDRKILEQHRKVLESYELDPDIPRADIGLKLRRDHPDLDAEVERIMTRVVRRSRRIYGRPSRGAVKA
jgi:hypothetical protein